MTAGSEHGRHALLDTRVEPIRIRADEDAARTTGDAPLHLRAQQRDSFVGAYGRQSLCARVPVSGWPGVGMSEPGPHESRNGLGNGVGTRQPKAHGAGRYPERVGSGGLVEPQALEGGPQLIHGHRHRAAKVGSAYPLAKIGSTYLHSRVVIRRCPWCRKALGVVSHSGGRAQRRLRTLRRAARS